MATVKKLITDIQCPSCGAPARFDIYNQRYECEYCGGKVGIKEAIEQKQGFRKIHIKKIHESVKDYKLYKTVCTGCGAELVFDENEAVSNCAFCGRSLVRREYVHNKELPEYIVPFKITLDEAKAQLRNWCEKNKHKREAKHLLPLIDELQGFYLPYELVRGPVHMKISRMANGSVYSCEGFINDEFVNRSKQLDNLLLDGMEPFDFEEMAEFDFAYVAGQRVKTPDVDDERFEYRVREEASNSYEPKVRKILETKAVYVNSDVEEAVRMPVLLPVYYINKENKEKMYRGKTYPGDNFMAAVNGQTGKVSVRAEEDTKYYFLPWWLKGILATIISTGVLAGGMYLFGAETELITVASGCFGLIAFIVLMCLYSDTEHNSFSVEEGRKIFTSGTQTLKRVKGKLVWDDKVIERKVMDPIFFQQINGERKQVSIRFTSVTRVVRTIVISLVGLFFPVICALFINGFNFGKIWLGGSAVWFCLAVPLLPVFLIKFGINELYDKPWIYIIDEKGRKKRHKEKMPKAEKREIWEFVKEFLFTRPLCFFSWFMVLVFIVMVYLTAGYSIE
ncbi:MAG: hypothetical protein K6E46_03245 [Lachnospiraceae bacterium]|nr:hypothetical protein [Lachnospiraceae bacterium]